ncbi:MAG: PEGA domain-containing protein [Vicinamibacterales bacterium]
MPRPPGVYPSNPIYGYPGYGYWYPWYGPGFGYGYGYGYYDPWYSGYGFYGSYAYGGYGGYSGGGGGGGGYSSEYQTVATGSIRLRVSPETAKVYIDGALMGTVEDFNGLGRHLDLPAGQHQIELRADGYDTYTGTVEVLVGKTMTERVSLNKKK